MSKDQIDPYDDLDPYADDTFDDDSDDWLDTDDSPTSPASSPTNGRTSHSPSVIQPDDDEDEDDYEVDAEDFDDFTPRRTRFAAPSHEDVLVDSARKHPRDDGQLTPAERRAQRRDEKIANRQARIEAKKSAAASGESAPPRRKNRQTVVTALGLFLIVGIVAGGTYTLLSLNDEPTQSASAENTITPSTSARPTDSAPATTVEAATDDSPNDLYTVIADACAEAGGTSEGGDNTSPEGAIRGFNHAYFGEKNATVAATFLGDGMYNTVETLQDGIDNPENGDAHCAIITPTDDPATFDVEIQEFVSPATEGDPITSWSTKQIVKLEESEGAWRILEQSLA